MIYDKPIDRRRFMLGAASAVGAVGLAGRGKVVNGTSTSGTFSAHKGAKPPKVTLKLGFAPPQTDPVDTASKRWAKMVAKRTDNRLTIQIFPDSSLASEIDVEAQARIGAPNIAYDTPTFLAKWVPDMNVIGLPFIFESDAQLVKVLNSSLFKKWDNQVAGLAQLHVLGMNWISGPRQIFATKPIRHPSDMKGLKIRVPAQSPVYNDTYEALGAVPVSMDPSEIYTSLQQGVIQGGDLQLDLIYSNQWYQVAKYICMCNVFYQNNCMVMSEKVWQNLPRSYQNALEESVTEAGEWYTKYIRTTLNQYEKKLKSAGATFIEPDISEFVSKTKGVHEKFSNFTPGAYEKVLSIIGAKK